MSQSAASIKGIRSASRKERPDPNTALGQLYDRLLKGEWVMFYGVWGTTTSSSHTVYDALTIRYDLVLEHRIMPGKGATKEWRMLGRDKGLKFETVEEVRQALEEAAVL